VARPHEQHGQHARLARARQAADFTDGYVHENPWRAIGVGAAIGLLIGYLVSRR
jgi:ElaB/YqjD/DUF883 family membrane-anchored ribosome-binding protein